MRVAFIAIVGFATLVTVTAPAGAGERTGQQRVSEVAAILKGAVPGIVVVRQTPGQERARVITSLHPRGVKEGERFSFSVSGSDERCSARGWTATVDYGDGSGVQAQAFQTRRVRTGVALASVRALRVALGGSNDPDAGCGDAITAANSKHVTAVLDRGPIQGVVVARQRPGQRRAALGFSLHLDGVEGGYAYSISASDKSCSYRGGDRRTIDWGDGTAGDAGLFELRRIRTKLPLDSVRSVRVRITSGSSDPDAACGDS
jgi:hypothetical protein